VILGRVVKGAQIAQKPYHVKAPVIVAVPAQPVMPLDDPVFAQMHEAAPASAPPAADDLLEEARTEAARLIDEAAADAERFLNDARERAVELIEDAQRRAVHVESDARAKGFEEGVGDGRAAASAEMDEMLQTMRGLVEMARVERHKIIELAEPQIVRLSVAIAERILNQHVAMDDTAVLEMTRAAITRLVNRETVTVRVNPADIETMRKHREKLMAMNDIDNMRVIEDQRVDRGGVVIETDAGTIDAKIATQLREVRRLLAVDDPISVGESKAGGPIGISEPAQAS
jgi:flagellar assembly protein FliH